MRTSKRFGSHPFRLGILAVIACLAFGCPTVNPRTDYGRGFDDGFALDSWYWDGYFDSFDTVDFEPILYQGSTIPFINDLSYDAGFWDGVWYAYNDGYFVDYRYAFILGFSEGYDNAYWPDYLDFLAGDVHIEFLNGGWTDGYNDGFSEGRVFGAYDFEQGLPFDWLDALWDYESGTDLFFEEVGVGTGVFGPVLLYEYGTDPALVKSAAAKRTRARHALPALRRESGRKDSGPLKTELYRPVTQDASEQLEQRRTSMTRPLRDLRLTTTWTERLDSYQGAIKAVSAEHRQRRVME